MSIVTRGTRSSHGSYFGHNKGRDEPEAEETVNNQQALSRIIDEPEASSATPDESSAQDASRQRSLSLDDLEEGAESEPDEEDNEEDSKASEHPEERKDQLKPMDMLRPAGSVMAVGGIKSKVFLTNP